MSFRVYVEELILEIVFFFFCNKIKKERMGIKIRIEGERGR